MVLPNLLLIQSTNLPLNSLINSSLLCLQFITISLDQLLCNSPSFQPWLFCLISNWQPVNSFQLSTSSTATSVNQHSIYQFKLQNFSFHVGRDVCQPFYNSRETVNSSPSFLISQALPLHRSFSFEVSCFPVMLCCCCTVNTSGT
ncbi:hypothetical protein VIGAN_11059500 [Vigna angularis var. angularis]|uniref:Uncharacterized protein n=1 Tax=Vigna angularis var. angularis TaxID=157739 RepID=A0A0S3T8P9_PHAAN|nr:hypothetical protein VIGAN_11059500 [Vigna angularis var. angularis]